MNQQISGRTDFSIKVNSVAHADCKKCRMIVNVTTNAISIGVQQVLAAIRNSLEKLLNYRHDYDYFVSIEIRERTIDFVMQNSQIYVPIKVQRFYEIHCVFTDGSVKARKKCVLLYTFEEKLRGNSNISTSLNFFLFFTSHTCTCWLMSHWSAPGVRRYCS